MGTPFKMKGWSPFTKVIKTTSQIEETSEPAKKLEAIEGSKSEASGKKTLTYKKAYEKADKSKYKTYGEFEKAAKAYNIKKYDTTEPTKRAKQRGMTKGELEKDVKAVKAYDARDAARDAGCIFRKTDPDASGC